MTMTRVHRPARITHHGDPSTGDAAGVSAHRRCPQCQTRYSINVDPTEQVVIKISGSGCPECEPGSAVPPAAATEAAPARRLKMWWASRQDVLPELVAILRTSSDGPAEVWQPSTGMATTGAAVREAAAEIGLASAATEEVLGSDLAHQVTEMWRPQYCEMVTTQASLLRRAIALLAGQARSDLQIQLRLAGAPALVASTTVEVLGRLAADPAQLSLTTVASALEAAGAVLCLGTGRAAECVAVQVLAERRAVAADAVFLRHVIDGSFRSMLSRRPEMAPATEILETFTELPENPRKPRAAAAVPVEVAATTGVDALRRQLRANPPTGPLHFGE